MPPRRIADVQVVTTLDLSGMISRRLNDAERKVFNKHRRKVLSFIQAKWSGWKYVGRPDSAPRNVSQAAWRSTVETTEANAIALVITNEARDYRTKSQDYVAYVHRSGSDTPEVQVVFAELATEFIPTIAKDLADEVAKSLSQPSKPQKLRKGGGSTVRAAALEI